MNKTEADSNLQKAALQKATLMAEKARRNLCAFAESMTEIIAIAESETVSLEERKEILGFSSDLGIDASAVSTQITGRVNYLMYQMKQDEARMEAMGVFVKILEGNNAK
jgi:hypothetical protein